MLIKCFHCGVNADLSIKRVDSVEKDKLLVLFECYCCKKEFGASFEFKNYHDKTIFVQERYVKTLERTVPLKEFVE